MMTKPAKIAISILIVSLIGFFVVALSPKTDTLRPWMFILEHGFEGAMVGCICDILAVRQVYIKAEENYERLTKGVSKTVVREMLQIDALLTSSNDIEQWLQDPKNLQFIQQKLREILPEDNQVNVLVEEIWDQRIHTPLFEWLLHANPQTLLHNPDPNEKKGLLDLMEVRTALALCMKRVAENDELADRSTTNLKNMADNLTLVDLGFPSSQEELDVLARTIWSRWKQVGKVGGIQNFLADKVIRVLVPAIAQRVETMTLLDILGPTLSKENLQLALERGSERVGHLSDDDIPDQLTEAVLNYFDSFLEAWNLLEDKQKKRAVEEVLLQMRPKVIVIIADVVIDLRMEFLKLQSIQEQEWIVEILEYLIRTLQDRSHGFGDQAEQVVTDRLQQLGPKRFRDMLQKRTQEPLDWIKVNGACWGFLIGAIAGGLSLFLHSFS